MKKRGWFTRSQLWFLLIVLNACLVLLAALFLSHYRNAGGGGIAETMREVSADRSAPASSQYYAVDASQPESFPFDPNEADSTQLLRLGLAPFQVRSIYRYRGKGGRFSTKDDFRRVYRLTNEQWEHLAPLIRIGKKYQLVDLSPESSQTVSASQPRGDRNTASGKPVISSSATSDSEFTSVSSHKLHSKYPVKLVGDEVLDVNLADSAQLCRVPGIGPYFSRKIVQYRKRLGGYVSTAQLLEIDDFPADAVAWLVVADSLSVQKLSLNHLTTRKLMKHPYMGYYRASDIENHKRIYGRVQNLDVLRQMPHFTDEDIKRLEPYLEF
jgi:DNA uptake protein ComE-like DNA-binding protein